MIFRIQFAIVLCAAFVLASGTLANATTLSFQTSPGQTLSSGRPVDAVATFVTSLNKVTVTLTNLEVNVKDISQTISGVSFLLDNNQFGTNVASSAGLQRTVNSNKTYADGATVPTGWVVLLDGVSMQLMLPDPVETHTIIGPASGSTYTGANTSIAGSSTVNPFLTGAVTFSVDVPGVTSATCVDWATFHFGSNCAEYIQICQPTAVPEPSTFVLAGMGAGCAGIVALRRRAARRTRLV